MAQVKPRVFDSRNLHITDGDEDHEIAQTLAATVPNAELFVYPGEAQSFAEHDQQSATLLHGRALDLLQTRVGDEFRAARGLTL